MGGGVEKEAVRKAAVMTQERERALAVKVRKIAPENISGNIYKLIRPSSSPLFME
jgi:hypothetical protein